MTDEGSPALGRATKPLGTRASLQTALPTAAIAAKPRGCGLGVESEKQVNAPGLNVP